MAKNQQMRGPKTMGAASMLKIFLLWVTVGLTCLSTTASGQEATVPSASATTHTNAVREANQSREISASIVRDTYEFSGLAAYYNQVFFYSVRDGVVSELSSTQIVDLTDDAWLVAAGRFSAIAIRGAKSRVVIEDDQSIIKLSTSGENGDLTVHDKALLGKISADLDQVKYQNLWGPFAWMAGLAEATVGRLQSWLNNWFLTLAAFSLLVKILLYPLNRLTHTAQIRMETIKAEITPRINEIKAHLDGEEAHNQIMAAHKELGVSPFYTLKPLLFTLIQIPVLIATFNALGEYGPVRGAEFLWVSDLAYPDSIGKLPTSLPLVGAELSLLPVIMAAVSLALGYLSNKRQISIGSILLATGFLILFYPFPAVLVLYWTLVNVWHVVFLFFEQHRQ